MKERQEGMTEARWGRRWLPLAALAAGLALVFVFDLDRWLSFETLGQHRQWLMDRTESHPGLALVAFMGIYVAATALSVPGAVVLTVAGGFLFGTWLAAASVLVAATLGACILFLAARTSVGEIVRRRAGPFLKSMEEGFRENSFSYLLTLRLVPLFPFFVVNLVPALFGMRLAPFALATIVGIAPGTLIFAGLGQGLGSVLDAGGAPDLGLVLRPSVLLPLLGLALLALLPTAYQRLFDAGRPTRRRQEGGRPGDQTGRP